MHILPSPVDADAPRRLGHLRALSWTVAVALVLAHLWGLAQAAALPALGSRLVAVLMVGASLPCLLLLVAMAQRALDLRASEAAEVDARARRDAAALGDAPHGGVVELDVTFDGEVLHALVGYDLRSVRGSALVDLVAVASRHAHAGGLVDALTGTSSEGDRLAVGASHAVYDHRPPGPRREAGSVRVRLEVNPSACDADHSWHHVGGFDATLQAAPPVTSLAA